MYFQYSAGIWRDFPALAPGVLYAEGITSQAEIGAVWSVTPSAALLAPAEPRFTFGTFGA